MALEALAANNAAAIMHMILFIDSPPFFLEIPSKRRWVDAQWELDGNVRKLV
jgi:hypothetical protein